MFAARQTPFLVLAIVMLCGASAADHGQAIATASALPSYRYPLSGGDKVRVIVFGDAQLGGDFTINGAGMLALPLVGEIRAQGQTSTELQQRIAARLKQGYVLDPKVAVEVLSTRPFYILGEVNKPGEYAFADGLTVQSAVAQAGGYTYRAKTRQALIQHAGAATAELTQVGPSTPVAPGDTIRIRERWF